MGQRVNARRALRPIPLNPLGRRTTLVFDPRSLVTQRTDGKGQVETRTYDALGRQTGSRYADGTRMTATYDALSRELTSANQNGIWTRTYDALGQRLTEVGPGYPSGLPLTSVYDPVGNRTALQTWRGVQNWGYDGLNRGQSLTDIEGGRHTWVYDLHGRTQEIDYANGVIFSVTYFAKGGPYQGSYSSGADPQVYMAQYDSYDALNQPTHQSWFWGGSMRRQRDMSYDAANQLIAWSDSDTNGPAITFDGVGNPQSAVLGTRNYGYTYDGADELVNLAVNSPVPTSATMTYL